METDAPEQRGHARRLARSTAFFSFATGLSRVLGLVREVVAARYFGVSAAMSAFTIAFQVPNLIRALVRGLGAAGRLRADLHGADRPRRAARGVPRGVEPLLPDPARARRPHGAVHDLRRAAHVPVRAGVRRQPRAEGPDGPPGAADVPDRRAAGAVGPGGRDAQLVRPLQRAGARAGGLERRDHRGARGPRPRAAGGRRDLRVRDRDPARDDRAVPAAAAVAAGEGRPISPSASTGATSA